MREELKGPSVENVSFAIIPEKNEEGGIQHYVYLINFRTDIMEGIIITSKGYGKDKKTGEEIKTSQLRHSLEVLLPNEAAKIEPIMDDVFHLNNEYWISFWAEDVMYDKKFVFEANTINPEKFVEIPHLNRKGIIIS